MKTNQKGENMEKVSCIGKGKKHSLQMFEKCWGVVVI